MTDEANETLFAWTSAGDYRAYPQFLNVSRIGGRLRIMVRRLEGISGEHPVCGAVAEMFLPDDELPRLVAALGDQALSERIAVAREVLEAIANWRRNSAAYTDSAGLPRRKMDEAQVIHIEREAASALASLTPDLSQ